jgi:RimJ/RimL family protein N-acetyltransferase
MGWRNEQIYHLRQEKLLTAEEQDAYFETTIANLFEQAKPKQLLFSLLKEGKCIGYGGLVHINWLDKNAEISFIMDTSLEESSFSSIWSVYLEMIENLGFSQLKMHKLFVYAFDLRPNLYKVLLDNKYFLEARLKEHCLYNDRYIDVVIHSKINNK